MQFYCVKCKAKKEVSKTTTKTKSGRRFAVATCPKCKTQMWRILGKA
jgi:NAD-dependent SIR2 family protein deacetylase